MKVRARWFAALKDHLAGGEATVEVPEGATTLDLFRALFVDLGPEGVAFARSGQTIGADTPLVDGDEVYFLPPFGGG
jgi:molybdopterin converting factor small subunit